MAGQDFLRLLSWVSPAFPTGGYAYSHGLEWAVERGDVCDVQTLCAWTYALLQHGSLGNDLVILHAAWVAGEDDDRLRDIAQFACATATSRERYEETTYQGEAFLRAAGVWNVTPPSTVLAGQRWPLPVAQGLVFRRGGVACRQAVLSGGYAAMAALVSAAVRLVPLGQTDGLHALARLEPALAAAARHAQDQTLEDVGGACFGSDLAAMYHETQETRLFRT
ncbi:urease accessory protein UreF [Acetobacter sp. TBRC 12305]|uniref:Urease accessory protein UreF n=1 Tax=Acetobacter garciniae TaxID=2817435 RepID=A0A939HL93_9PROT|nr:urease accessory UreF family protein [Acetobacter garciniae]MBO1326495.1 urease accessory protein UreF [Acetobacter garciniae]MBX0346189.1 urease accessory protein UreF [Acetobacter garciniae]